MVDEMEAAQNAPEIQQKQVQLREVNKAIASLERVSAAVPEELRNLRIKLTAELAEIGGPNGADTLVRQGVSEIAGKLGISHGRGKARRMAGVDNGRTRRTGMGVELPPTGKKPYSIKLNSDWIRVSSWKDVLVVTANWLISRGHRLPEDGIVGNSKFLISPNMSDFRSPKPLDDGRYINTHYSSPDLVRSAYQLLMSVGLGKETLEIQYS